MRVFTAIGALFCLAGVVAGALGAHAFKDLLAAHDGGANFELATRYMFYHGLGLLVVGQLRHHCPNGRFEWSGWLFMAGTVLFQGNLFLIGLYDFRTFQFLTPVGGMALLAGWLLMAVLAMTRMPKSLPTNRK